MSRKEDQTDSVRSVMTSLPLYVVTFNRVRGLREASNFVKRSTVKLELVVLDMGSSWKPFIEFRDSLDCQVLHFPLGMGPRDLWTSGALRDLGDGAFFLGDGDLDYSQVRDDAAERMMSLSESFPWFPKVGLALRIDDLPDDQETRRIRAWEHPSWAVKWDHEVFLAPLDTTLAYYPRRERTFYYRPGLRIAGDYQATHYPWYEREGSMSKEALAYRAVASNRISSTQAGEYPSRKHRFKRSLLLLVFWLVKPLLKFSLSGMWTVRMLAVKGKKEEK